MLCLLYMKITMQMEDIVDSTSPTVVGSESVLTAQLHSPNQLELPVL